MALTACLLPVSQVLADTATIADVAYGPHPLQVLDIYNPETVTQETPVVVFFHGGGWNSGGKFALTRIGKNFSNSGVIFVAPDYRLSPEVKFPEFIEDCARAVSYVWNNVERNEERPRPLFLAGWSAGAYNAALLAVEPSYLAAEGLPGDAVTGLIGLSGPYSGGLCAGLTCNDVFPKSLQKNWAAPDHVSAGDPPMFLAAVERDLYVDRSQIETMADAAAAAGVDFTMRILPGSDHSKPKIELSKSGSTILADILSFMSINMQR
jgi:acetyl esterase/lipase